MNLDSMTVAGYMAAMAGKAARDIVLERMRQITVEGWTPEHDDHHRKGEMALAGAAYAYQAAFSEEDRKNGLRAPFWPASWSRPRKRR